MESCLYLISLYFLLLLTSSKGAVGTEDAECFASCLSSAGVTNFTTLASCSISNPTFDRLLYSSAHNLRFVNDSYAKPLAVVLPTCKEELRAAVLCCRRSGLAIRVRSGGHSYEGMSYTSVDLGDVPFAVIDLMNLAAVLVDAVAGFAWVEAGATLGEVYHAVAESSCGKLALSAGSCPTVGAGGHVAGGGFGLLSRKYGLAADNVIDAVLVSPEGRILDREAMGEDVFWAVRGGGGGCWGAVYAWKLKLVPVPERVTAFVVNRPGTACDVARLVYTWQSVGHGLPDEFYLSAFVGAGLPEFNPALGAPFSGTFKGLFLGRKAQAVSLVTSRFPELGLAESDCLEMSWIESVLFFSGLPEGSTVVDLKDRSLQEKKYFKAKSDYVRDPIGLPDLVGVFDEMVRQPLAYLILDPYGGVMDRIPSDELPFPHRRGNLYAIQHLIEWHKEEDVNNRDEYLDWIRRFYDRMEPLVSSGPRAAYINYLDLDLGAVGNTVNWNDDNVAEEARSWGDKYFLGNYERLVKVKTMFDPENVFRSAQSIPPLSPAPALRQIVNGFCDVTYEI